MLIGDLGEGHKSFKYLPIWLWFDPGFWSVMCPSIQIAQMNKPGYIYHSNLRDVYYLVPWFIMRYHVTTLRWPSPSAVGTYHGVLTVEPNSFNLKAGSPSIHADIAQIFRFIRFGDRWNSASVIFSKPTIICARFPRNPVSIPMTFLSISTHFDLATIPRFCCLCQCMSLIPLTFLNVSIFWKLFSLGSLHRCQWKNPNFCCQPTQKNLLRYPHLGQAQTKVAKVAKVAVCTSAHQTVLRKLAPSNLLWVDGSKIRRRQILKLPLWSLGETRTASTFSWLVVNGADLGFLLHRALKANVECSLLCLFGWFFWDNKSLNYSNYTSI